MKLRGHVTLPDDTVILTDEIEVDSGDYLTTEIDYEDGNPVGARLIKVPEVKQ